MEPREVMRATAAIAQIGAAFYFTPETIAHGKERLGIDGYRFYFLGRGGVLGDADAEVVRAAFGYFEPSLLRRMWETAIERAAPRAPREIAREYLACAHEFGRDRFAALDRLDEFVDGAGTVIGSIDGASLPLFAGVRAEPVPADAPAAAMHQAIVLRELRGSVHLLSLTAVGLPSRVAHAIRRPNDQALFGYGEDALPDVTDADRTKWDRAESLTDEVLAPAYGALRDAQAKSLIAGTTAMAAAVAG